jgi:hypothetical protein
MRYQAALTLFAVFTAYTIGANASNKSDIQELKQRVACLEERPGCCAGRECPTCSPDPENDLAFFLWGEGLYWKVSENGLPSCLKFVTTSGGLSSINVKHPPFNWHWGFRVGAGYNMCHDLWTVYATYTRFHFSNPKNVTLGPDRNPDLVGLPSLLPLWVADSTDLVNFVKTKWRVHFDQGDVQLGRNFYVSDSLILRPHFGLRTAWIRQKYDFDMVSLAGAPLVIDLNMKNNFWGFGGIVGLDTTWEISCGFSLLGNVALSILDGHFDTTYDLAEIATETEELFQHNHQNSAVLFADLFVGFQWMRDFCCERFRLGMWAGYEQHIFFEQNQFMNLQFSEHALFETNGGNLNMNGVTIGLEFGF